MNLIYSVAFGHELYFQHAQEMANSARRCGYKGHITIITDREYPFTGAFCMVAEHKVGDLWKTEINKLIALDTYDKVLFVDSDIAFIKNPDILFELNGFKCGVEKIKLASHPLNGCYLTAEEKEKAKDGYSFNSGTILMPGADASRFLDGWNWAFRLNPVDIKNSAWDLTVAASREMRDQAALQVLCTRNFSEMEGLPEGTVFMPGISEIYPDEKWEIDMDQCILIHFNGPLQSKVTQENILSCMKLCAIDVPEVIRAFKKYTRSLFPKDPMTLILDSIKFLADGVGQILDKNKALEAKITELSVRVLELEKEPEYVR